VPRACPTTPSRSAHRWTDMIHDSNRIGAAREKTGTGTAPDGGPRRKPKTSAPILPPDEARRRVQHRSCEGARSLPGTVYETSSILYRSVYSKRTHRRWPCAPDVPASSTWTDARQGGYGFVLAGKGYEGNRDRPTGQRNRHQPGPSLYAAFGKKGSLLPARKWPGYTSRAPPTLERARAERRRDATVETTAVRRGRRDTGRGEPRGCLGVQGGGARHRPVGQRPDPRTLDSWRRSARTTPGDPVDQGQRMEGELNIRSRPRREGPLPSGSGQ